MTRDEIMQRFFNSAVNSFRSNWRDGLILTGLLLLVGVYAVRFYDFSLPPTEDAAMLMRYSEHLAQGFGIVWNVGEKPVDGATDFLFMVVLAGLARAGLALETAARLVGLASHALTVIVVYAGTRKLFGAHYLLAFFSALYLAIGPAISLIAVEFGTPFFALFAATSWYLAYKLLKDPSHLTSVLFALSGLTLGLIRPEGVWLSALMLAAVVFMTGWEKSKTIILWWVGIVVVIGGIYFIWHWSYFGYPLPNPFYKKGAGGPYWDGLLSSIKNVTLLTLPFLWVFIPGLLSRAFRPTVFALIPIVGFTGIWVLLSSEANDGGRFQYAVLPLVLISWVPLLQGLAPDWILPGYLALEKRRRVLAVAFVICAACVAIVYRHGKNLFLIPLDSRYDVAVLMNKYKQPGYTIATSEAGLLPFYSEWRAVDTWGLNDQWIAHNGAITESYLDGFKPQVIMFHAYFSAVAPVPRSDGPQGASWTAMVLTLKDYAEKNGYVLAADYGLTPYDTFYYYVRADFPESAEIVKGIRAMRYVILGSPTAGINYAPVSQ
jgi:arabinofuranosyltransferase